MDTANIISMAASNVVAGSDTTALSVRAIIYYLLKNSECKERLIEEVDSATKGSTHPDVVAFDEANRMPYLKAVMHEAMRMHAAVGQTFPRAVPPDGLHIGAYFIPGGVSAKA